MIEMVRVPDGKRVPVGPWDLDHIRNVMAVPMARTYVNGKLKGGLWFDLPGPEQIAEGRLAAEFGFEAQEGENELILELIERDRERMNWGRLAYAELRKDDRRTVPLEPASARHPRVFLSSDDVKRVRERWNGNAEFEKLRQRLRTEDLVFLTDNSQGTLEVASLVFALTGDEVIGARVKTRIMELARPATWSGRPDPLLMETAIMTGSSGKTSSTPPLWPGFTCGLSSMKRSAKRQFCPRAEECYRRRSTTSPCCSAPTWDIRPSTRIRWVHGISAAI